MAKARGVDAKLARLRALRHDPPAPEHLGELRAALVDKSNLVVAEAVEIVGARGLVEFVPDLRAAFERFMVEPEETDKLCRAKTAIVEVLNKLEYDNDDVFLRGVRHVQFEPVWGGQADTASHLRGSSALGLVRINYSGVVLLLADLLADPEKVARQAAAQALGETRAPAAIPLLRYKARVGDKDAEVTGDCLTALMVAAPKESLPFVADFLHAADEAKQQGAAFALGESRRPDALDVLIQYWPKAGPPALKEVILLAIATTRLPDALEFLLEQLAGTERAVALAALNALAIHRHNEGIRARIADVIANKSDAVVSERFGKKFSRK